MKTDYEIQEALENDTLDTLSFEELQRLEQLLKIKNLRKNDSKPTPKIQSNGQVKDGNFDLAWYNSYIKSKEIDDDATNDITYKSYFENADSDTGCADDVSSWSPEDSYVRAIWHTFLATSDLFQVAVKGVDIRAGDGLSVQIKTVGEFDDPTEKAACECASCASISFNTYTLTVKQYNMEAVVCDKDAFDVGYNLIDSYIEAMTNKWKSWFDEQIYSELETASAGITKTLPSSLACSASLGGSCCSDTSLYNLYNAIEDGVAEMRESSYKPNFLIISPTVARVLKSFDANSVPAWVNKEFQFDTDGKLSKAAGLKVIEYAGANSCTDATGEVVAIIVDSRRAVGAAFGKRPQMYKEFQQNCNSYRIDFWSFFAVSELDCSAICHVCNP